MILIGRLGKSACAEAAVGAAVLGDERVVEADALHGAVLGREEQPGAAEPRQTAGGGDGRNREQRHGEQRGEEARTACPCNHDRKVITSIDRRLAAEARIALTRR